MLKQTMNNAGKIIDQTRNHRKGDRKEVGIVGSSRGGMRSVVQSAGGSGGGSAGKDSRQAP